MTVEPRIACRTPAEGRDGVTNIPQWKFDLLRAAIEQVLADGPVPFSALKDAVRPLIAADDLARLGSLGWHVTVVKLELEVRGVIMRLAEPGPQKIALAGGMSGARSDG